MLRKALIVCGGLIALYIVVENYTGFSKDVSSATSGGSQVIATLQGRTT
jgi:hypothetical protein